MLFCFRKTTQLQIYIFNLFIRYISVFFSKTKMYICKKRVICDFVILILRVYWIIFCIMRIMYFYLIILTELLFVVMLMRS